MKGTITGWDVDQDQDVGLLSAGYKKGTRLEAFDLKTAKVTHLGSFQSAGGNGFYRQYIVLRILANDEALVDDLDFQETGFQRDDTFPTVSPISGAKVTGRWKPPHRMNLLVNPNEGWVAVNQRTTTNAIIVDENTLGHKDSGLHIYVSDIEADTFSPEDKPEAHEAISPPNLVAQDTTANRVVLPMQIFSYPFNPFESPSFDIYDVSSRKHTIFSPEVGSGAAQGIAIDPTTHLMCTTTADDSNVEFYDLTKMTGIAVPFPGSSGQLNSGGAVAVDTTNHLFIVTQPNEPSVGSIVYVYDEKGNLQETIPGFSFSNVYAAVFAYVAVNPKLRIGYATGPGSDQLQSFTY